MEINREWKVDILLKLLEENRKQTEWVKNLDHKIVYYTVLLFIVGIAWLASKPYPTPQYCSLLISIIGIVVFDILFLIRNHYRHIELDNEIRRISKALLLNKENEYNSEAIYPLHDGQDFAFHAGRFLYIILIIFSAFMTWLFIYEIFAN